MSWKLLPSCTICFYDLSILWSWARFCTSLCIKIDPMVGCDIMCVPMFHTLLNGSNGRGLASRKSKIFFYLSQKTSLALPEWGKPDVVNLLPGGMLFFSMNCSLLRSLHWCLLHVASIFASGNSWMSLGEWDPMLLGPQRALILATLAILFTCTS